MYTLKPLTVRRAIVYAGDLRLTAKRQADHVERVSPDMFAALSGDITATRTLGKVALDKRVSGMLIFDEDNIVRGFGKVHYEHPVHHRAVHNRSGARVSMWLGEADASAQRQVAKELFMIATSHSAFPFAAMTPAQIEELPGLASVLPPMGVLGSAVVTAPDLVRGEPVQLFAERRLTR